jgi:hypothetical protein
MPRVIDKADAAHVSTRVFLPCAFYACWPSNTLRCCFNHFVAPQFVSSHAYKPAHATIPVTWPKQQVTAPIMGVVHELLAPFQDFRSQYPFQLGTRRTGRIIFLRIANTTYVPEAPRVAELRPQELLSIVAMTPECAQSNPSKCFHSTCLLDMCVPLLLQHTSADHAVLVSLSWPAVCKPGDNFTRRGIGLRLAACVLNHVCFR